MVVNYARQWLMLALSIVEGLALSALYEGFARGVVYLHAACPERSRRAHLPAPKSLPAKSSVSITSKLIEIKGLQLHHFGHLRKIGGRGSHRLVHTAHLSLRKPHGTKSNHSRTLVPSAFREGYVILRGWGSGHTRGERRRIGSQQSTAVSYQPEQKETSCDGKTGAARLRRRPLHKRRAGWALRTDSGQASSSPTRFTRHGTQARLLSTLVAGHRPLVTSPPPVSYITTVPRAYCARPCQNGT
jgi:hypothetical protein